MSALGWLVCAFGGGVAGISMAAVINALGIPARIVLYSGQKSLVKAFPWLITAGAAVFSYASMTDTMIGLPAVFGMAAMLLMGIMIGISAVSLAEMLDMFVGIMGYLRKGELRVAIIAVAFGKAVIGALHLIFWGG